MVVTNCSVDDRSCRKTPPLCKVKQETKQIMFCELLCVEVVKWKCSKCCPGKR